MVLDCILCYHLKLTQSQLYAEDAEWVEWMHKTVNIAREAQAPGAAGNDDNGPDLQTLDAIRQQMLA